MSNNTTESKTSWQRSLDVWRARDAYNAQTVLWLLAGALLFLVLCVLSGCATYGEAVGTVFGPAARAHKQLLDRQQKGAYAMP
jgi:hypothetical protein